MLSLVLLIMLVLFLFGGEDVGWPRRPTTPRREVE